jgi:hypothetical protein
MLPDQPEVHNDDDRNRQAVADNREGPGVARVALVDQAAMRAFVDVLPSTGEQVALPTVRTPFAPATARRLSNHLAKGPSQDSAATLYLIILLGVGHGACESRSPAAPTPSGSITVAGRIVDAVDSVPVVQARLSIAGMGILGTTSADGSFSLSIPEGGNSVLEIEAPGYWKRTTKMKPTGSSEIRIDVLPNGKGFSLPFFDYVFRQRAPCVLVELATTRWLRQPTFELWTSEFTCQLAAPDGRGCDAIRSSGRAAPAEFIDAAKRVVQELHAVVLQPAIVDGPGLPLAQDFVAHDGFGRQQAQQAKLCKAAEQETRILAQIAEPVARNHMMNMPLVGKRDPDVDVREKK